MRHAAWTFAFLSTLGLGQIVPDKPGIVPRSPETQTKPKLSAPLKLFLAAPHGSVQLTSLPEFQSVPPTCSVPLLAAPLGNAEQMPVTTPATTGDEPPGTLPAPPCEEPGVPSK